MANPALQQVDHSALKGNQLTIIALSLLAFIFNLPLLALVVALVMGVGTVLRIPGFILVYRYMYKPLNMLKPDVLPDHPEPHRFAQFLGFLFLAAGSAVIFVGFSILGWGLVWLVIALAALNAFGGFCVGCSVYYWLAHSKVPGFTKLPPVGTVPGMKPRRLA